MARLVGVDLPRNKRLEIALTYIYGIGPARSKKILEVTGISPDLRTDDLTDDDIKSNNEAIVYNDRILASYKTSKGKIYIIADATDKNYYEIVTVLFANEY